MLDTVTCRFIVTPPPALPVAQLLIGKPADEAAMLLPRIFNLCPTAQAEAVRRAFSLPVDPGGDALAAEIKRDHLQRFFAIWPRHFGWAPRPLPKSSDTDGTLRVTVFGEAGGMPSGAGALEAFIGSNAGIAAALGEIASLFAPGEAAVEALPFVDGETAFDPQAAVENSIAARHAAHPVMRAVEAEHGRGPFWRALGRAYDLERVLDGDPPRPLPSAPGTALVPTARGLYAVRGAAEHGIVTAFERVTPTDHLLAGDGMLAQSLATLPAHKAHLAPLLLDILDPCQPVTVKEAPDA